MRLAKGAKETFGWVIVGLDREIKIPSEAWKRYDFEAGDQAIFLSGSRKSGGFGLTNLKLLTGCAIPGVEQRFLGFGWFNLKREVQIPENISVHPGDRLLTVFGSSLVLGFITQGPIYEQALQHLELEDREEELL